LKLQFGDVALEKENLTILMLQQELRANGICGNGA